jgi:hypothetical protein
MPRMLKWMRDAGNGAKIVRPEITQTMLFS